MVTTWCRENASHAVPHPYLQDAKLNALLLELMGAFSVANYITMTRQLRLVRNATEMH